MDSPITYKDAGVDIAAGEAVVNRIRDAVKSTYDGRVLLGIGGHSGVITLPHVGPNIDQAITAGTDGVGAKIDLAIAFGDPASVGADLVHHCIGDCISQGARPMAFLDYYATAKLDPEQMAAVVVRIAKTCRDNHVALLGGETAEMPGTYMDGKFDLIGTMIGHLPDTKGLITGQNIKPGDRIIGLPSDGPHTNGYSLVRRCLERAGLSVHDLAPWNPTTTAGASLLRVHKNYLGVLDVVLRHPVNGIAHITGGGIPGNLIRILPEGCRADIDTRHWRPESLFDWLKEISGNDYIEMYTTFNMGMGMLLVCSPAQCKDVLLGLRKPYDFDAQVIGQIVRGARFVNIEY